VTNITSEYYNLSWILGYVTYIPVRTLLASLAEGASIEEIQADLPTIEREDVHAVISYAAAAVVNDLPVFDVPPL
jgi:hypothetical protein